MTWLNICFLVYLKKFANVCFLCFCCYICENVVLAHLSSLIFCIHNQTVIKDSIMCFSQMSNITLNPQRKYETF